MCDSLLIRIKYRVFLCITSQRMNKLTNGKKMKINFIQKEKEEKKHCFAFYI